MATKNIKLLPSSNLSTCHVHQFICCSSDLVTLLTRQFMDPESGILMEDKRLSIGTLLISSWACLSLSCIVFGPHSTYHILGSLVHLLPLFPFGSWFDNSLECQMPHKVSTRKKQPMVKALAQKKMALAQKSLSVWKAPLRKGVTSGKGNCALVTANPAPVTSWATIPPSTLTTHVSTGALHVVPTLDQGMLIYYCCSQLTAPTGNGAPMATVPLVSQDQNLLGQPLNWQSCMVSTHFVCATKKTFSFSIFFSSNCHLEL